MAKSKLGKVHPNNIRLEHYPTMWLSMADDLKRTELLIYFDILRDHDQMLRMSKTKVYRPVIASPERVHLLIIGFAIENLLKCLYLNKHPEIIASGNIVDNLFKTHNLLQIASQRLNIQLSDDEKFLLEIGTKAIRWYGRYPIPLKETETFSALELNRKEIHFAFHVLYERLYSIANIKMPHHYRTE